MKKKISSCSFSEKILFRKGMSDISINAENFNNKYLERGGKFQKYAKQKTFKKKSHKRKIRKVGEKTAKWPTNKLEMVTSAQATLFLLLARP